MDRDPGKVNLATSPNFQHNNEAKYTGDLLVENASKLEITKILNTIKYLKYTLEP